jgi:hypothetical protein
MRTLELQQLLCRSGYLGRMQHGPPVSAIVDDDSVDNEESVASEGSRVTVTETIVPETIDDQPAVLTPSSPPDPAKKRNIKRKPQDDCHVIIDWSQLAKLIQENMACSNCGSSITNLDQRTTGIATNIHFSCKCRKVASALAD